MLWRRESRPNLTDATDKGGRRYDFAMVRGSEGGGESNADAGIGKARASRGTRKREPARVKTPGV